MDEGGLHQNYWDRKYARHDGPIGESDPWLATWIHRVPPGRDRRRALDVGCGPGHNTHLLMELGFAVSAIDISERALALCKQLVPGTKIVRADIREGLPFAAELFDLIVADQSLHYFPFDITTAIVRRLADRLVAGGLFLGRFNSASDTRCRTAEIEKRFFTCECMRRLFGPPWNRVMVTERRIRRAGHHKRIWEVCANTRSGNR